MMDNKALRFNFCMQVWGRPYVELMLDVALPSQLSAGNLLDFPWGTNSRYEIYTTKEDERLIVDTPVFRRLERTIETRFIHIDAVLRDNKWPVVRHCHQAAVNSADARNAGVFFLCPDIVWPTNCFANAGRRIAEGYSAVLCPGLRTVRETLVPELKARYQADECSMPVPNRELVRVCLEHLHPEMKLWFWDDPGYYKFPTYILFSVPSQGVTAFCYILHPVVLYPQIRNAPFRLIFDQDYLQAACPDFERLYIARDSDEIIFFEISPNDAPIPPMPEPEMQPVEAMTWYGEWQYNSQHRQFVKRPVRIHHAPVSERAWTEVERRGHDIVKAIEKGWALPDKTLLGRAPKNLIRRIQGRNRFEPEKTPPRDRELLFSAEAAIESSRRKAAQRAATVLAIKNAVKKNFPPLWHALRLVRNSVARLRGPK